MVWPIGSHYKDQSNVTHAGKLKGKLFLIHGEVDNNVVPSLTTMKVVDALIKANKDFDMLVVPGTDHGQIGAVGSRRRDDFFAKHLLGIEPPNRNAPRGGGQ